MTVARSILGYTTELSATMAAIAMIAYKIIDCRFFLLSIPCPCVVSPQTRRQRALWVLVLPRIPKGRSELQLSGKPYALPRSGKSPVR